MGRALWRKPGPASWPGSPPSGTTPVIVTTRQPLVTRLLLTRQRIPKPIGLRVIGRGRFDL